ncbi:TPA: acyltransferase family protein [Vibrio diabolicus]|uniref:acyltransferase family protein n=1 Tax=Vibrio TaxID=662 RepID=UPI00215F9FD0|nr:MULTISPECIES: acyltransferase family protein [Vibrio]MCS0206924.1 acyltransferase [Vibrio sp. HS-50-1]MCS0398942.1 acyltransferase [Vibrio diabolicus]
MTYRAEVDGLRAIAVTLVILFHAGVEQFAGGFIGVDVFFVISGYLITTIVINDLENQKFSLGDFYERRIRRILPLLLVVIAVSYLMSWWLFLPQAHKDVGQFAVSSILSSSNILLYLKGHNYFGLEDQANPLFHTWSLGVEEQYYIVIPLLLMLLARGKNAFFLTFFVAVFALSLMTIVYASNDPDFTFYMIFSRAWELATGSLLALVMRKTQVQSNDTLATIGIVLILASALLFEKSQDGAGITLLVPVIGSALVILFASKDNVCGKLLSLKWVVFVGLISYSLYLWHIPLFVFYRYMLDATQDVNIPIYIAALFILSYFTWRFVEKPFRSRKAMSMRTVSAVVVLLTLPLLMFGVIGHQNGGFPERSAFFEAMRVNNGYGLDCNGNTDVNDVCSSAPQPTIAVLGNSHSMVYVKRLSEVTPTGVVQLTQDSCAVGYVDIIKDAGSISCRQFFKQAIDTILRTPSIRRVVISSNFNKELSQADYEASLTGLLNELEGKEVVVFGPTPSAPFAVGECLWKARLFGETEESACDFSPKRHHPQNVAKLVNYFEKFEHVEFVDLTEAICRNGVCRMKVGANNAMYTDDSHLSYKGAELVLGHYHNSTNEAQQFTYDRQ